MLRLILRRLALLPPALLLVNFLGYAYAHLVLPIRAARIPYLTALPDPGALLPSYLDYLGSLLHLDLGTLPGLEQSLADVILQASKASAGLLAIALALSVIVGVTLGIWAVKVEPRRTARWLTVVATGGMAMPSFYIGSVLLMAAFFYALRWGGSGPIRLTGYGWDLHLLLPVLALMARPTVQLMQMTAGLLETELGKRYIRTARSIGHLWRVIRRKHAMRNILAPVVLLVAGSARLLMGELILVEWLFGWPGLGNLFAQALVPASSNRAAASLFFMNPPVVATVLTAFAAFFLIIDLGAAILVRLVDPRLQGSEEGVGTADVVSSHSSATGRNWRLILGGAIVFLVIVLAVVGPFLAPQDPLEEHTIIQTEDGWETAPFPVFRVPGFPLGSDDRGRDLLSRLLWGIRPTMIMVLVVALVRLVLGTIVGIVSGWSRGRAGRLLDALISGALAVPVLMVALAAIAAVGLEVGVAAFLIGLSITGWAETARLVREQTRLVRGQQYIEAAQALGLSDRRIMIQHVLRQIMPMVWMLLALEISGTLMATAALGFLGYYMGGDVWVEVQDYVTVRKSGMPELGQMLATANTGIVSLRVGSLPWAMVAVGTLIFVIILGFNLFGDGLRRQFGVERRRSTFISAAASRAGAWTESRVLLPASQWVRGHALLVAAVSAALLVIAGGTVWWQMQATARPEGVGLALPVPGDHLWAAERRDPYGTLWTGATEPGTAGSEASTIDDPQVLWRFRDLSGFSGGPAVAVDGTVYISSNDGRLYALNPDGDLLWEASVPRSTIGTPALDADGNIYVADGKAGLSAFAADGTLLWRFRSQARDVATTGAVVAPGGSIYFGLGSVMQAVSAEGSPLWNTTTSFLYRTSAPALSPAGDLLFWQEAALDTQSGALYEPEVPVRVDRYFSGGDGLTYLNVDHNVARWEQTEAGVEIVEMTRWDSRALGVRATPIDVGVTHDSVVWLHYGSRREGTRIVWLESGGKVLGAIRIPHRSGRIIATGNESVIHYCGVPISGEDPAPRCSALSPDLEEPVWEVSLENGDWVIGGALVPGRLYATVSLEEANAGVLVAVGQAEAANP